MLNKLRRYANIYNLAIVIVGAAFFFVARTLRKDSSLKKHMITAACGFLFFYIAGSAFAAQAEYPPFGAISVSFIGLSCYLIYAGLYSSAATVSLDTTLRLSIRKSLADQAKFLDSVGSAHMEHELQSTVLKIAKKHSDVMTNIMTDVLYCIGYEIGYNDGYYSTSNVDVNENMTINAKGKLH